MGSDNLYHKRKQRGMATFKRKESLRKSYDVVLIVCEGKKTERNYLLDFRDDLKLHPNIKVIGLGEDPLRVVDRAVAEYESSKDYDRVYCVFDKDEHTTYQEALVRIESLRERANNPLPIYGITSVPCFEYWLLLHFIYSTSPCYGAGGKSAGDRLKSKIKDYIDGYSEASRDVFEKTKSRLDAAIERAKRVAKEQAQAKTDNPSTNFHELAEYMLNIKHR